MNAKGERIFGAFLKLMEKEELKYLDIKEDLDGDIEAITFSNNEIYIKKVQDIETTKEDGI